jgi:hypothetical protein
MLGNNLHTGWVVTLLNKNVVRQMKGAVHFASASHSVTNDWNGCFMNDIHVTVISDRALNRDNDNSVEHGQCLCSSK